MKFKILAIVVLVLGLACASLASAAEVTRETYKEAVEPICETNTKANEKILGGVRQEVKAGKLKTAGAKFSQAAAALEKALKQIEGVAKPSADEAKLGKWFGYIKDEAGLFKSGASALKAGDKHAAQSIVAKLTHDATLANNEVIAFGFRYCRLEPSRFT
jgi:hypothetical protein